MKRLFVCATLAGFGCSSSSVDPPATTPVEVSAGSADKTRCPTDAEAGGGALGCWFRDPFGMPAYEYTLPIGDPKSSYFTFAKDDTTNDQWHQLGNLRVTAFAHVDGRIRLFDGTRGSKFPSPYSEFAIRVGNTSLKKDARRLTFGMGYVESASEVLGVKTARTVYAPWGALADIPVLIIEHSFENTTDSPQVVAVRELWDARMHQLSVELAYTGSWESAEDRRSQKNAAFQQTATFDATKNLIAVSTKTKTAASVARTEADALDYYPGALALASLDGPPTTFALEKTAECAKPGCTEQKLATIGGASAIFGPPPYGMKPTTAASVGPKPAEEASLAAQMERTLTLKAKEKATIRFAVAYGPDEELGSIIDKAKSASLKDHLAAVDKITPKLDLPGTSKVDQAIAREMAWHAYYFLSAANYESYYGVHAIDQGSAYGYLMALRGAARDSLINAVALIHVNPDLAREQIEYILQTTEPTRGKISYGTSGYGKLEDALVHDKPTDLALWMLWAVVEYVEATRDTAFLDKSIPYWPPAAGKKDTVRKRLAQAYEWLNTDVGVGEHGLLKVGSGDWSDGISYLVASRKVLKESGESVFNTAFAKYVFPRVAGLISKDDPDLAAKYLTDAGAFEKALSLQFNGKWFHRAWDGAGKALGDDTMFLEHHTWMLVDDSLIADRRTSVVKNIDEILSAKSPIGTWILYPPIDSLALKPGWDVNGGIWAAMNGLLVWGFSKHDPARAWKELVANSMTQHATAYPNIWYGIWSGPDAYNAAHAKRPGETFYHLATPMTDYPVGNSNRHALPLIDAVKLAGIDYDADGAVIDPKMPFPTFAVSFPLAAVKVDDTSISGKLTFKKAGRAVVTLPKSLAAATNINFDVGGKTGTLKPIAGKATLDIPAGITSWKLTK